MSMIQIQIQIRSVYGSTYEQNYDRDISPFSALQGNEVVHVNLTEVSKEPNCKENGRSDN